MPFQTLEKGCTAGEGASPTTPPLHDSAAHLLLQSVTGWIHTTLTIMWKMSNQMKKGNSEECMCNADELLQWPELWHWVVFIEWTWQMAHADTNQDLSTDTSQTNKKGARLKRLLKPFYSWQKLKDDDRTYVT